jgi:hypothetical protein
MFFCCRRCSLTLLFVLNALVLLCFGCGKAGHDRFEVRGLVTLDGTALPSGLSIRFAPQKSEIPDAVGATDAQGRYIMYAEQGKIGLRPGVYTVSVERPLDDLPGPYTGPPEFADIKIPMAYRRGNSTLTFTVPTDGLTFDIPMKSE